MGKTGEKYELTLSAEEYRLLNRCLDVGVATSIENFWRGNKDRENRVITERFGFFAHELRNALGNTNMAFKLLRVGGFNVNGRTADVLERNLLRMEALVAQCLAGVQLEAGVAPELFPVRVASVLRNLEASTLADRDVAIQLELDEQLFIAADEMLLTSALSNLLHNAVKFSPHGSTVRLSVPSCDGSAVIQVEDECGGLKHDNPEEIFKPYVKSHQGNPQGTGLGLAIAKRAVEAMHGELNVADQPGQGCVFSARFPLLTQ